MGPTSSQLECYLSLLPESLEIGDHTDTVDLGFEGQPFTVKNGSVLQMLGAVPAGNRPVPEEARVFHHSPISTRN